MVNLQIQTWVDYHKINECDDEEAEERALIKKKKRQFARENLLNEGWDQLDRGLWSVSQFLDKVTYFPEQEPVDTIPQEEGINKEYFIILT